MLGDRSRSDTELGWPDHAIVSRVEPCPQPCPELGESDPIEPHLDEDKHAQTAQKPCKPRPSKPAGPGSPRVEGSIPSPLRGSSSGYLGIWARLAGSDRARARLGWALGRSRVLLEIRGRSDGVAPYFEGRLRAAAGARSPSMQPCRRRLASRTRNGQ